MFSSSEPIAPFMSIEEFRAQFTEDHRAALAHCLTATQVDLRRFYMLRGASDQEAQVAASRDMVLARSALTLIFRVHPPDHKW